MPPQLSAWVFLRSRDTALKHKPPCSHPAIHVLFPPSRELLPAGHDLRLLTWLPKRWRSAPVAPSLLIAPTVSPALPSLFRTPSSHTHSTAPRLKSYCLIPARARDSFGRGQYTGRRRQRSTPSVYSLEDSCRLILSVRPRRHRIADRSTVSVCTPDYSRWASVHTYLSISRLGVHMKCRSVGIPAPMTEFCTQQLTLFQMKDNRKRTTTS